MMSDRIPAANVRLKRAYEPAAPTDGLRILVDRLWPRGVSKTEAALDLWDKDIAPSSELRRWFGHDPEWRRGVDRQHLGCLQIASVPRRDESAIV